MKPIRELSGKYKGMTLRAVGKGPSLASLSPDHIGEGPVMAINSAIEVVEALGLPNDVYSLQKDHVYVRACQSPILVHKAESHTEDPEFGDYIFDNEGDFGMTWHMPSMVVCLSLARLFECSAVEYLCCDSAFGDYRTYEKGQVLEDERAQQYRDHPGLVMSMRDSLEVKFTRISEHVPDHA